MHKYNPNQQPDAAEWLALDELGRIGLVNEYHLRAGESYPGARAHAAAHAVVETQLAEGLPHVRSALERLLGGGLDRHESIHAIASVLMGQVWELANRPSTSGDPNARYVTALDALTVESWRRSG